MGELRACGAWVRLPEDKVESALSRERVGMVDIPGNASTTVSITVGGSVTDAIEVYGDSDWVRADLIAGQQIVFTVHGVTLEDPYLRVRNGAGLIIAENDDISAGITRDSRYVLTVTTSGTYYLDVGAWTPTTPPAGYTGIGQYTLSATNFVFPPLGTLDQIAFQMTDGYWGGSHHFAVTQGGSISVDLTALADNGRAVALQALQLWSDIIGVAFVQQTGGAQITFDDADAGTTGAFSNASWNNGVTEWATVNVAPYRLNLHTYMHEIGHALGLAHTSNSNAGTAGARYPEDALFRNDSSAVSVMSYFDNGENTYYAEKGFSYVPLLTPQVADIIAIGNLYGLATTTRTGNTTYGFHNNSGRDAYDAALHPNAAYTIFDNGGVDTLDYSGFSASQLINLNPEAFSNVGSSTGNVVIARGTVIENAIGGSGGDIIVANGAANTLTGGAGSDVFLGTLTNLGGDTVTDFARGDRIVISDAVTGLALGWTGSQLTYGSASLTLSNVRNPSIAVHNAAEGGIEIVLSGPPIILAGGPAAVAGENSSFKAAASASERSPVLPIDNLPASWPEWLAPCHLTDDMFAMA